MFLLLAEGCGLQMMKFVLLGHHIIPFVCQIIYIFGTLLLFHVERQNIFKIFKMQLFKQT